MADRVEVVRAMEQAIVGNQFILAAPRPHDIAKVAVATALARAEELGWKLLPREPSEEMADVGDEAIILGLQTAQAGLPPRDPEHASIEVYQAMYDAAGEKP